MNIGIWSVKEGSWWAVAPGLKHYTYQVLVTRVRRKGIFRRRWVVEILLGHPKWCLSEYEKHKLPLDWRWGTGLVPIADPSSEARPEPPPPDHPLPASRTG